MEIRRALPRPELRGIVRSFEERRVSLGSASLYWPVAPRPDQIIDIYLCEPFRVGPGGGPFTPLPEIVVVGPQTHCRAEICLSGDIHVFNILFQPAGFSRLTGIDMTSLVNQDPSAADVLGKRSHVLNQSVRAAGDFQSRVAAVERWLGWMLEGRGPAGSIDSVSCHMMDAGGQVRVDAAARQSELSPRQFQRLFTTRVGMTPKAYARTIRFDQAIRAHRDDPSRPWTNIVHDVGYFDQAHFIRECHTLVGVPPSRFGDDWRNIFFPARG